MLTYWLIVREIKKYVNCGVYLLINITQVD